MKYLLFFLITASFGGHANQPLFDLYDEMYESEEIDPRGCGENIRLFFNKISEQKITYKSAYALRVDEKGSPLYYLNARWGASDRYEDGQPISLQRYYYHVFGLVDGLVYDFSSANRKPTPLKLYLEQHYRLKKRIKKILPLNSHHADKDQMKLFLSMPFKVTELRDYILYKKPTYQGLFVDAFFEPLMRDKTDTNQSPPKIGSFSYFYNDKNIDHWLTYSKTGESYQSPSIQTPSGLYPIQASHVTGVCQALGFTGSNPKQTVYSFNDNVAFLDFEVSSFEKDYQQYSPGHQLHISVGKKPRLTTTDLPEYQIPFNQYKEVAVCQNFNWQKLL